MCRIIPKTIDTLVVSYGGVGTTFVIDFLQKHRNVNDSQDTDGLKHLPFQPISLGQNLKVLYVFGDPVEAVISLFRRRFHSTQSVKLSPFAMRNVSHEMSLEEYADLERDSLLLGRHFRHWLSNPLGYPTLFVSYHDLWSNLDSIFDFFEISKDRIDDFPRQKTRNSSVEKIDPIVLEKLTSTYDSLREELASIGSIMALDQTTVHPSLGAIASVNAAMIPYHSAIHCGKKLMGQLRRTHSTHNA